MTGAIVIAAGGEIWEAITAILRLIGLAAHRANIKSFFCSIAASRDAA